MAVSSPRIGRGEAPLALSGGRDRDRDRDRGRERDRDRERDRPERDRSERERGDRERPDRLEKVERAEKEDSRPTTRERDWKTNREAVSAAATAAAAVSAASASTSSVNGNSALSLRLRIGDALPSGRGISSNSDIAEARKRTLNDRERDSLGDSPSGFPNSSSATGGPFPPKRLRLKRDRY